MIKNSKKKKVILLVSFIIVVVGGILGFAFYESKDNYFLNDLDFEIRKGETFAIIGGTGSGKSTIINLIERFYDASKGNILYKGIPLKEYDLTSLRKDIGLSIFSWLLLFLVSIIH